MLIKKKTIVMFVVFLTIVFLLPQIGFAQNEFGLEDVDTALGGNDLTDIIANIINIFLGLLGIIATIIMLYGGYLWMTAQGDGDQVIKAKQIIINGIIGLIIIMLSYAIVSFVFSALVDATDNNGGSGSGNGGGSYSGGGLGAGILESHYPVRDATDIVMNTNIFITFKEALNIEDFIITDCNHLDSEYTECIDNEYIILMSGEDNQLEAGDLMVKYDSEQKVFEFNPYGNSNTYLDSDGNTEYTMVLNNLETVNGNSVFFAGAYAWDFVVSNDIDTTPPEISSIIPINESSANARNSIVQINFSEAINPNTAAGIQDANNNFTNIILSDGSPISGQYLISNQYQTVEFNTFAACGENSCGGIVYCLPGDSNINGIVSVNITDMAGNSLIEEYLWSFTTSNEVDLEEPKIISRSQGGDISLENPLKVVFDKSLSTASLNSDNISLYMTESGDWNYWLNTDTCDASISNCNLNCTEGVICNNTININHDKFLPATNYIPELDSGIKDLMQNCWYPCDLN